MSTVTPSVVETLIETRERKIVDGFSVRRALPSSRRRMVEPFIFLDQMGPEILRLGAGLDVAPHPHIGLATVTYLFRGELLHRDGLGSIQTIRPGEVNWMTAGRGIAHSERTPAEVRQTGGELFGIQSWVALPAENEDIAPAFDHFSDLPEIEGEGKRVRVICGSLFGQASPVETLSDMFYADADLMPGASLDLPSGVAERAIYVVQGSIELGAETITTGQLAAFVPGREAVVASAAGARLMLFGGEPVGKRHIWWNFVSSSTERIDQAIADWKEGRFAPVPEETEFIPAPEGGPAIVRYP